MLSPYHPGLYQMMKRDGQQVLAVERTFREIAKATGVRIIGSYDPDAVGCGEDEFFDGMHPKATCMAKVLASLHD